MAAGERSPTPPVSGRPRPPPEPDTIVLLIRGSITRADIPGLCERVRVMLDGCPAELVVCDVGALVDPDAVTVDALARLQLTARRLGSQLGLRQPCGELQRLLALTGLSDVVPVCGELSLESGRQTEQWEPPRGIEEEADPADPIS